ncbi:MAG: hypothetical protein N2038_04980 [Geminicoccaceae bacterium]|nr:hypothetical protein [Geminicoccaceae bacterium]MCX7629588.1 hypothetical protein [Geminicoccaceae bacterium]MDW8125163.1 hypothetical protein [Geminicoccaceae bacterium]MDW8341983.1 hypothetical protein [Geminicoccaceae bacterium]
MRCLVVVLAGVLFAAIEPVAAGEARIGKLAMTLAEGWSVTEAQEDYLQLELEEEGRTVGALQMLRVDGKEESLEKAIEVYIGELRKVVERVDKRGKPVRVAAPGGASYPVQPVTIRAQGAEAAALVAARSFGEQTVLAMLTAQDRKATERLRPGFEAMIGSIREPSGKAETKRAAARGEKSARPTASAPSGDTEAGGKRCRVEMRLVTHPTYQGCIGPYCSPTWTTTSYQVPVTVCD